MEKPLAPTRRARSTHSAPARAEVVDAGQGNALVEPCVVLTWNVNAKSGQKSAQAPADDRVWSAADNLDAVQAEVLRWRPDVFALQECVCSRALPRFDGSYVLLGSRVGHSAAAGAVYLYAKTALEVEPLLLTGVPGVGAVLRIAGQRLAFLALHLASGSASAGQRRRHLQDALAAAAVGDPGGVVLLGDLNVRDEELADLLRNDFARERISEAGYSDFSWNPRKNLYI